LSLQFFVDRISRALFQHRSSFLDDRFANHLASASSRSNVQFRWRKAKRNVLAFKQALDGVITYLSRELAAFYPLVIVLRVVQGAAFNVRFWPKVAVGY